MKILVVDDEEDIALLFRQKFRREIRSGQLELAFAFSGTEALEYLQEWEADDVLVLSDINMPGMDGLEMLRRIKKEHPTLPVYMITAYANEDYRRTANEYGSNAYLTKPLDFDELRAKIFAREDD